MDTRSKIIAWSSTRGSNFGSQVARNSFNDCIPKSQGKQRRQIEIESDNPFKAYDDADSKKDQNVFNDNASLFNPWKTNAILSVRQSLPNYQKSNQEII